MQWGVLDNFSKYTISNTGVIKNIKTGKVLKTGINRYGYEKVKLFSDTGHPWHTVVHRCVAKVFLVNDNPVVKFQVNHLDGVKLNNFATNLEWSSAKTNINHSFDLNLNTNKNAIEVLDVATQKTTNYRSVKQFACLLGMHSTSLIPLLKRSGMNPILGKYIVKLLDEKAFDELSNVKNFGRELYVFDCLSGVLSVYPSINLAAYHTGIRSLSLIDKELRLRPYHEKIGFRIAFSEENIPRDDLDNPADIALLRDRYHQMPYVQRDFTYKAFDYVTRREYTFESSRDLLKFLNSVEPFDRLLTMSALSTSLTRYNGAKNAITKGCGVRSSQHYGENDAWFNYSEAELFRSKYNIPNRTSIYRIVKDGVETVAVGMADLCNKVGYIRSSNSDCPTPHEILMFLNDPNLHVEKFSETLNVS